MSAVDAIPQQLIASIVVEPLHVSQCQRAPIIIGTLMFNVLSVGGKVWDRVNLLSDVLPVETTR